MNAIRQYLLYVDGVNILGKNINTMKKNPEVIFRTHKRKLSRSKCMETKYMLISLQSAGQNRKLMTANKAFKTVAKFKY